MAEVGSAVPTMILRSVHKYGTLQLNSGDVMFNDGEAIIDDIAKITEIRSLLATGRYPHIRERSDSEIEKEYEKAKAEASRLEVLMQSLKSSQVIRGATNSGSLPNTLSVENIAKAKAALDKEDPNDDPMRTTIESLNK